MEDNTFLSASSSFRGELEDLDENDLHEKSHIDFVISAVRKFCRDQDSKSHIEMDDDDYLSEYEDEIYEESLREEFVSRKTDWILVEDESLGAPFPSKYCWLCDAMISVPFYRGKEGGETIFMHRVCVDLPMEMEHELHRGHTLRNLCKIGGSNQVCISCNELGYVYYKCSDCEDFVLDIRCALKLFPIRHRCHRHPLIPIHKSEDFHCVACQRVHYGISYQCNTCPSFRIHQDCVSQHSVKLPSHRHELEFVSSLPEDHFGEPIYCQICREGMKEETCAYHCARCRFFFHTYDCRTIKHFSKPSPLVLIEEEGANAESASANCGGCGLKISVPYYLHGTGIEGSYFLHKFCSELPQSVEHHLHPGHDLTLETSIETCDACHAPWEGFGYSCPQASCRFSIDIICALKNKHLQHKFHQHPLISSHAKASFACRACNRDTEGPSYKCTTCRFWVHQQCASLPISRKHVAHPHVLKLTYSLKDPVKEGRTQLHCHVCRKEIKLHNWAYHCAGCKYYTHAHDCSDPPWSRVIVDFDYKAALAAAVHLPGVDDKSVSSLATMFFMETNRVDDKNLFLDPNGTCHRCAEFLAAPCNNCNLCNYFLPKSHADLLDGGAYSLFNGYSSMLSDSNENSCNGMGMRCEPFKIIMTVSSSVLPRYVKHEGHRHVLLTTFITNPTWCSACETDVRGYAFRCNICDFTIDTYCALLPGSIRHKYDKKHPFKLTFYSVEDVEEYVCEICEKDITTMWFFHCAQCDHSIHSRCIWKLHIEFGPFVDYVHSPTKMDFPLNYGTKTAFTLAPTAETQHPLECSECEQKETSGCRYSLYLDGMTHLQCKPDTKMERWPIEREELPRFLKCLNGELKSQVSVYILCILTSLFSELSSSDELHNYV